MKRKRKHLEKSGTATAVSLSLLLGLFGGMGTAAQEASPYYAAEEIPSSTAAALELTTEELTRVKRSDRLYSVDVEAPDGSGRSITLPTPLKYTDGRGEVRWIDTAMEPVGDIYSFYSGYDYRNAANRFTVYYSQWPDAGLDLDGDFRLSAVVPEGTQRLVGYPVDDTLVYPDAFGAFSRLEQSNISEGVSQTVIFTEAPLSHTFAFRLQSSAFRPSLSEDGSSILLEKTDGMPGESYTFSAFVLANQSGAVQGNAAYTLVQAGEGEWEITVTMDEEIFAGEDVVYPLTATASVVGPQMTTYNQNIQDTYISRASAAGAYASASSMSFGRSEYGEYQAYIWFTDFENILESCDVSGATLKLTLTLASAEDLKGTCMGVGERWDDTTLS